MNWDLITTEQNVSSICNGNLEGISAMKVRNMFEMMKGRDVENKNLNRIVNQISAWGCMSTDEKSKFSIEMAGIYNTGDFVAFMDVLKDLKEDGKL